MLKHLIYATLLLPFTACTLPSLSSQDFEREIHGRVNALCNEVFSSLSDCEKECLIIMPQIQIIEWLMLKKRDDFINKINNVIESEMIRFLSEKYKLNFDEIDDFKSVLIFAATAYSLRDLEYSFEQIILRATGYIYRKQTTPINSFTMIPNTNSYTQEALIEKKNLIKKKLYTFCNKPYKFLIARNMKKIERRFLNLKVMKKC